MQHKAPAVAGALIQPTLFIDMKLHLPLGLRSALLACFALVSGTAATALSAAAVGTVAVGVVICSASTAAADSVTWDANWNLPSAPTEVNNILTELPAGFTFLSREGSTYFVDGQTIVRLAGTEPGAESTQQGVNVIAGAGAVTQSTSEGEGPLLAQTWLQVTGGTYATLVGGSYAQNYDGGEPSTFTGASHILLTGLGDSSPTVDYIVGGNYMDGLSAAFTGNSYISVQGGSVNGSIVGAGTSAHLDTATFNGDSNIWVYTPLSGTAAARFSLPGNLIVGGNAAVNNTTPQLAQTGNSSVTIDLSTYNATGSESMDKVILGDAYLLPGTTSTHEGSASVSIQGQAAGGTAITFSQPVVAGSWLAGSGSASLSRTSTLSVSGGNFKGMLVGGSYLAAGGGQASVSSGDIALTISGGTVDGNIYGGSYSLNSNAGSSLTHGNISIALEGGTVNGSVYAAGGLGTGAAGTVTAASTQVEISNDVLLGVGLKAPLAISGGAQNVSASNSVTGERVLLLSGNNAYTNLDNVIFYGFNKINNAGDASIKLNDSDSAFTKMGAGKLTIIGEGSNLNTIADLTVAAGALDTSGAWLTRGPDGLTSITVGEGASLKTAGLTLADGADLSLNVANATGALISIQGNGSLGRLGEGMIDLTLLGVDSVADGASVTLINWNANTTPLEVDKINWVNRAPGMEAFTLTVDTDNLVLTRTEGWDWSGDSGTWSADSDNWEGQTTGSPDAKALTFGTPTDADARVGISGSVSPQSVVVDNGAETTYTFAEEGTGEIAGATSLTKENEGTLVMQLENSYTGGTMVNGGTLDAAVAGALGTGAVQLNEGGTLLASAEGAVAGNALVLNGGTLSYTAAEERNLDTAAITNNAEGAARVSVSADTAVTWEYTEGAALQSALGKGLELGGGGTLQLDASAEDSSAALSGPITLNDAGTTLALGSAGSMQLGTAAAPVAITLGEGTSLSIERPQAATPSAINATLSGAGTLEFAASNAAANSTVQLRGNNAAFAGSVNLGAEDEAPLPTTSPAVLLDYSAGSPVGATLNLNGLGFATVLDTGTATTTAAAVNVNRDTTQYAQMGGLENTFSGAVAGAAAWTLDTTGTPGGQVNALTGDLSGFTGTLSATGEEGSLARWVLGGEAATANPVITAKLSATDAFNEFVLDYAEAATLSGAVTGQANLTQQGAGTLTLTGDNTSSGSLTVAEGSELHIGSADDAGQWGSADATSTLAGPGTLTLAHGGFNGRVEAAAENAPLVNVDVAAGQSFDMGENEGSLITGSITLGEGATLTNVASDILGRELNLTLAQANLGTQEALGNAMVQFVEETTPILRAAAASLGGADAAINLDMSATGVVQLLREQRVDGVESYLTLTNGQLVVADDYSNISFGENLNLLDDLGLRVVGVEGGSLVISGAAQGVYIAGEGEDPTAVSGYQNLGAYQTVAVMPGETLTLTLPGAPDPDTDGAGATLNNLLGAGGASLVVNNTDADSEAVVILNNAAQQIEPSPGGLPGFSTGPDTSFDGSISQQETGGDVQLVKTGPGTLSVGGDVRVHQVTAQGGTLALNGAENALDVLNLDGGTASLADGRTTAETLEDGANGGTLALDEGATLVTTGSSTLENASVEGPGTLQVTGDLTLADAARLDGVALELAEGDLVLDGTTGHTVAALNGTGTVNGTGTAETVGLTVTGTGGTFDGALVGDGTLSVAENAQQNFGSGFAGAAGWDLVNEGRMGLNFAQEDGSNGTLTLGAVNLGAGSVTDVVVNTNAPVTTLLALESLTMAPGAQVNLSSATPTGDIIRADESRIIGTVSGGQAAGTLGTLTPDARQTVFMLLDAERTTLSVDEAGNLVMNLVTSSRNNLALLAGNSNSAAGAELLWDAAFSGNATTGTDIRRVLDALNAAGSRAEADGILAAASGASVSVLGSAMAADIERQLRGIRNRSMGSLALQRQRAAWRGGKAPRALADAPRFGAWIYGEGDHRKMDADGFMPGYSLSSWGGTVGMDMSCDGRLTAGLALTALYGDLDAHSADHAEGDFDRYYISAFASGSCRRWQHTLVGTVGRLDGDWNRTVSYGSGSYHTHGGTKGWGYGLMYEIGYSIPMDDEANFTLQPIANVSWRYADIDGYTERGSDAALRVGDQDYNVVTFGAGVRTRAEVGKNLFNREALLEARALVKVDTGDRSGEATVAMLGGGGRWAKVRSEKLGAVGVELGAGLTFPLGEDYGAIFIDGSAELRNEYSNLNGTLGYRFEF